MAKNSNLAKGKTGSDIDSVIQKYRKRIKDQIAVAPEENWVEEIDTKEYRQFKKELLPAHLSRYESYCNKAAKILNIRPDKKKASLMQESIDVCHLNTTPAGVVSFSILAPMLLVVLGSLLSFAIFQSGFFIAIFVITGLVLMSVLSKLPEFFANNWRMKASNEMVLAVFYIVTYMRHTSNLENAINFASQHLTGPLALDLRKVIWDYDIPDDEVLSIFKGEKKTFSLTREKLYSRLLLSVSWYRLLDLFGLQKITELLSEDVLKYIWIAELRERFRYVRKVLNEL